MIDVKQLMIGNVVWQPQLPHIAIVTAIDYRDNDYYFKFKNIHAGCWCSHINPIPLTEKVLEACGFEYGNGCKMYIDNFEVEILTRSKNDCIYYAILKHYTNEVEINNLHTLQNLFLSITQTELQIDFDKLNNAIK